MPTLLYENASQIANERIGYQNSLPYLQSVVNAWTATGLPSLVTADLNPLMTNPDDFLSTKALDNSDQKTLFGFKLNPTKVRDLLSGDVTYDAVINSVSAFWLNYEAHRNGSDSQRLAYDPSLYTITSGTISINETAWQSFADKYYRFYSRNANDITVFSAAQSMADSVTALNNLVGDIRSEKILMYVLGSNGGLSKTTSFDKNRLYRWLLSGGTL